MSRYQPARDLPARLQAQALWLNAVDRQSSGSRGSLRMRAAVGVAAVGLQPVAVGCGCRCDRGVVGQRFDGEDRPARPPQRAHSGRQRRVQVAEVAQRVGAHDCVEARRLRVQVVHQFGLVHCVAAATTQWRGCWPAGLR